MPRVICSIHCKQKQQVQATKHVLNVLCSISRQHRADVHGHLAQQHRQECLQMATAARMQL
jgi:hypothetical protein